MRPYLAQLGAACTLSPLMVQVSTTVQHDQRTLVPWQDFDARLQDVPIETHVKRVGS